MSEDPLYLEFIEIISKLSPEDQKKADLYLDMYGSINVKITRGQYELLDPNIAEYKNITRNKL